MLFFVVVVRILSMFVYLMKFLGKKDTLPTALYLHFLFNDVEVCFVLYSRRE